MTMEHGAGGVLRTETPALHLLCPQVGPSQPSLQTQVKASPPPTQVPPLEHGLEAQVLFLAGGPVENVLGSTPPS